MPPKPRGLGNLARQNVVAADNHLAGADRLLAPQSQGEPVRYELIAVKSRLSISEARRLLEKTLALGAAPQEHGDKP